MEQFIAANPGFILWIFGIIGAIIVGSGGIIAHFYDKSVKLTGDKVSLEDDKIELENRVSQAPLHYAVTAITSSVDDLKDTIKASTLEFNTTITRVYEKMEFSEREVHSHINRVVSELRTGMREIELRAHMRMDMIDKDVARVQGAHKSRTGEELAQARASEC